MNFPPTAQTGDWCHMLSLSMCLVAFRGNYSTHLSHQSLRTSGRNRCLCFFPGLSGGFCASSNVNFVALLRNWDLVFFFYRLSGYLRVLLLTGTLFLAHLFLLDTPSPRGTAWAARQSPFSNDKYVEVKCDCRSQSGPLSYKSFPSSEDSKVNRVSFADDNTLCSLEGNSRRIRKGFLLRSP